MAAATHSDVVGVLDAVADAFDARPWEGAEAPPPGTVFRNNVEMVAWMFDGYRLELEGHENMPCEGAVRIMLRRWERLSGGWNYTTLLTADFLPSEWPALRGWLVELVAYVELVEHSGAPPVALEVQSPAVVAKLRAT